MKDLRSFLIGFLQALSIFLYVIALFLLMDTQILDDWVLTSGLILFLFCFSALLCSSLVFAYPVYLLFQKRNREAVIMFVSTVVWMGMLVFAWALWAYFVIAPLQMYGGYID